MLGCHPFHRAGMNPPMSPDFAAAPRGEPRRFSRLAEKGWIRVELIELDQHFAALAGFVVHDDRVGARGEFEGIEGEIDPFTAGQGERAGLTEQVVPVALG
jgi:hypothetical protein